MGTLWKLTTTWLAATMASIGLGVCGDGAVQPTSVDQALTLLVATDKASYVLYEPVYLTCTLKNTTWSPIAAEIRSLALEDKYLTLSVEDARGERSRYYSGPVVDTLGNAMRDFLPAGYPGDMIQETVTVFHNDLTGRLAFPARGQYRIHGKVFLGRNPDPIFVEAQPVPIDILEPRAADVQLLEALGGQARLIELVNGDARTYCGESSKQSCYVKLRSLVARFSDSSYAPTLAFSLARLVSVRAGKGMEQPDLEVEILQEILERWPRHPLVANAMKSMALALQKAGRGKEALELVARFEEKYPGRESPRRWLAHVGNVR